MKHSNIFWGGVLVVVGVLLLMARLELFVINWWALGRLWPMLLVLWGISILPIQVNYKVVFTLLAAGLAVVVYIKSPEKNSFRVRKNLSVDWDHGNSMQINKGQVFTEPWEDGVDEARLRLVAAAGVFRLGGTTGELMIGRSEDGYARYSHKVERTGRYAEIKITEESTRHSRVKNDFVLMLNPQPIWQFKFDIGAADFDFDLTEFRVKKLDIDAGASSIKIKLGDKEAETHVKINAGASSINIEIPESAGCVLKGSTVLSNRELSGFEKVSKGNYITQGFDGAAQKIFIKIDAAVSNLEIRRVNE